MSAQSTMFETRAQALGIKPKVLANQTRRTLASVRKQLTPLARPWIDIDNSIDGALDDLLRAFDKFEQSINDSIEYLNQVPEED
jgi:hypothetical protein